MSTHVGLTTAQATKLIELAEAAGQSAKVRTYRRESSQHRGRAFLLKVINRHQALIQPFTHRKEEVVDLNTLSFWKSGCEFDITEAISATEERTVMSDTTTSRFVVFSKKWNGVWGGESRKWIKDTNRARFFSSEADAIQCANKQRGCPMSNDAIVMHVEEAHALLNPTPTALIAQTTPTQTVADKDLATSENKTLASVFDDDLTAILNFDRTAINKAIDDCQQAAKDLQQIDVMRVEVLERLQKAKSVLGELTQSLAKSKTRSKAAAETKTQTESSVPTKPGLLKAAILEICNDKQHCDGETMFDLVSKRSPKSSRSSIQQALYKMRADGLIKGSNVSGWNLASSK
jgi:hypothetical protein